MKILALLLLSTVLAMPAARAQPKSYTSAGHTIAVDVYPARPPFRHAAILILHGSGGMLGNQAWMHDYADRLSHAGYAVYVPHYFDRTHTLFVGDINVMRANFLPWLSTVTDAIAYAQKDSNEKRIGVLGLSLGGFLATSAAARDRRIQAVVEMCGGLPGELKADLSKMPPTLIMHGGRDTVVPVIAAYQLISSLQLAGRPLEYKIYDNQGHGFTGPEAEDARGRTLAFFSRRLPVPVRTRSAPASDPSSAR